MKLLYLYYTEKYFKKIITNIKKIIDFKAFLVRHPVLRSEKPIESCHFDGGSIEITLHFDLYDTKICKSYFIFELKNDLFTAEKQYQKKGFGEKLILNSEKYCRNQNSNLVWFNSTKEAFRFY